MSFLWERGFVEMGICGKLLERSFPHPSRTSLKSFLKDIVPLSEQTEFEQSARTGQ